MKGDNEERERDQLRAATARELLRKMDKLHEEALARRNVSRDLEEFGSATSVDAADFGAHLVDLYSMCDAWRRLYEELQTIVRNS